MNPPLPTIILPVFNAHEALKGCIRSLDRHSATAEIIVIDDASTDRRIRPLLEEWCQAAPRRSLLVNAQNGGFVSTANRGMAAAGGDVVLLNSDTVVTPGWLDALARCLASDARIATATPWSNNGEIVSLPEMCVAAPVPRDTDAVARAIAASGAPCYPDIPTAVGFCMAISRRALERVGDFNAAHFGPGYGEENDFSLRATAAGLRNVLCDDAYVVHLGGASFSSLDLKPGPESMSRLRALHPDYEQLIASFIREDPLAARRRAVVEAMRAVGT